MARLLYVLCGILAPLAFGIFLALSKIIFHFSGIGGYIALLVPIVLLLWLQRLLRVKAMIHFALIQKFLLYSIAAVWWFASFVTSGVTLGAMASLGEQKNALVQLIRNCWIVSRLSELPEPTFGDLFRNQQAAYKNLRSALFYKLVDPNTNSSVFSSEASKSSCFDIVSSPKLGASLFAPSIRATLPDITDNSAARFQNFTESVALKGKNLNIRPWNRVRPDGHNIKRTCINRGYGCNSNRNAIGKAW